MLHIFDGFIVFQVLRVYAISGLKWHLALLVGMFSVVPLSYSIVSIMFRSLSHSSYMPRL